MKLFNLEYYSKNTYLTKNDLNTTNLELINTDQIISISEVRQLNSCDIKYYLLSMVNKEYYYITQNNYYDLLHFTFTEPPVSKTAVQTDDWIKINAYEDLPTESGKYKVVLKGRNTDYGDSWWIEETWTDSLDAKKWVDIYSHYKLIEHERYPLS